MSLVLRVQNLPWPVACLASLDAVEERAYPLRAATHQAAKGLVLCAA